MGPEEAVAGGGEVERAIRRLMLARNAPAVREVAARAKVAEADLESTVRSILEEQKRVGTEDRLGPRYDIRSGKHLTLEEWAQQLLR